MAADKEAAMSVLNIQSDHGNPATQTANAAH